MLRQFIKQMEKRTPLNELISRFSGMFQNTHLNHPRFTEASFHELMNFLEHGEASYQSPAVQAAVKWSDSSQKVLLRNTLSRRGFVSPVCLWAYRQVRGNAEVLFKVYDSPEMAFMQILLLKETDLSSAIPVLIERFLLPKETPEELRNAARLCILRLLDAGVSPDQLKTLQKRYPGVALLHQWRAGIYPVVTSGRGSPVASPVDFHALVRSVRDVSELSSLTRTLYVLSLFYIPLTEKEWASLMLGRADFRFFQQLRTAGIVEEYEGGFLLSSEPARQNVVRKFLYEAYVPARESLHRRQEERVREDRERRVRNSELDRQALDMVPDGIICVDRKSSLYYLNVAAERMLSENQQLRARIFGEGSLEEVLKNYERDKLLANVTDAFKTESHDQENQVFGDRVAIGVDGKRFEVELGPQIILIRDVTDRHLIDKEIGKLYRHELKAALEIMGAGLETVRQLLDTGNIEEGIRTLGQVEEKRKELSSMLEERIDFIRLHSDTFRIRPTPVNLNLVVDTCINNYQAAAQAKKVKLTSNHLHTLGFHVRGEERFLVRALDNIIRNAVRFSSAGGEVRVSLGGEDLDALVRVDDNGPGIPPENLGKIFQLGFTTNGSGRGLYMAKRIIQAHNGRIDVKSKPGNGTSFTIRLPLLVEA